jgi:hypothetical protein
MAIYEPVNRFTFDFADLRRAPPPELRVLPPQLEPLPAGAGAVTQHARPKWLPPLLPVFRTSEPLRVSVLGAEAPVWARRIRSSLGALFASAGGPACLQVLEWQGGFSIGGPGVDRVPVLPHAIVLAAECDSISLGAAAQFMARLERERCIVVVHGNEPVLDGLIGIEATQLVRFPLIGPSELAALAHGGIPGLTDRPFGRACFGLARAIVGRYQQLEP